MYASNCTFESSADGGIPPSFSRLPMSQRVAGRPQASCTSSVCSWYSELLIMTIYRLSVSEAEGTDLHSPHEKGAPSRIGNITFGESPTPERQYAETALSTGRNLTWA